MMRVGVTGSHRLNHEERIEAAQILTKELSKLLDEGYSELYHGGAPNVDEMSGNIGHTLGFKVFVILPKVYTWEGDGGFKKRNKRIVQSIDLLVAVHSPRSKTGGTIWTYDYAIRRGVKHKWFELS
jgi:hypothetical protein